MRGAAALVSGPSPTTRSRESATSQHTPARCCLSVSRSIRWRARSTWPSVAAARTSRTASVTTACRPVGSRLGNGPWYGSCGGGSLAAADAAAASTAAASTRKQKAVPAARYREWRGNRRRAADAGLIPGQRGGVSKRIARWSINRQAGEAAACLLFLDDLWLGRTTKTCFRARR